MNVSESMEAHVRGDPSGPLTDDSELSCLTEGSCYVMNSSTWLGPLDLVVPLYGGFMPLLICITSIANSLIITVLSRPSIQSPTNTVLLFMAISDLLTIIIPGPWYFWLYSLGGHAHQNWGVAACFSLELCLETLPQLFHTASIWLTLALASQRYLYVCHPHCVKRWCTVQSARTGVGIIFCLSLLHLLPRFMDRTYASLATGDGEEVCRVQISHWVQGISVDLYFSLFYWFRVACVHLLPCLSLVILNCLLFRTMSRAEQSRTRLLHSSRKAYGREQGSGEGEESAETGRKGRRRESRRLHRDNQRQREARSTTLMLIVVILVFLATEIPLMVITVLHTLHQSFPFMDYEKARAAILILNVMLCSSYPLNFAIYCGMSRQFRDHFYEIFVVPMFKLCYQRENCEQGDTKLCSTKQISTVWTNDSKKRSPSINKESPNLIITNL